MSADGRQGPARHAHGERSVPLAEAGRSGPGQEKLVTSARKNPLEQVLLRLGMALSLVAAMVMVVYLDRAGYTDTVDGEVSLVDAAYYATVSLSTTGYGDITPVTTASRLTNIFLITPLRILFLLILIGTTLEALTERSREELKVARWRRSLSDHVVVCGYGTKGRSAVNALLGGGTKPSDIVVVDDDSQSIADANEHGLSGVVGSTTRSEVLRRAKVGRAKAVVVAVDRDDSAVLTVLTVRQMAPQCTITAAVREQENAQLLRTSGADTVIVSSEASGRLLGIGTEAPDLVEVAQDLLEPGTGLELAERSVAAHEVGCTPRHLDDLVVAVARDGVLRRFDDADMGRLRAGDQLVVVKGDLKVDGKQKKRGERGRTGSRRTDGADATGPREAAREERGPRDRSTDDAGGGDTGGGDAGGGDAADGEDGGPAVDRDDPRVVRDDEAGRPGQGEGSRGSGSGGSASQESTSQESTSDRSSANGSSANGSADERSTSEDPTSEASTSDGDEDPPEVSDEESDTGLTDGSTDGGSGAEPATAGLRAEDQPRPEGAQ